MTSQQVSDFWTPSYSLLCNFSCCIYFYSVLCMAP